MKVLLTGAAGFVGARTARALLEQGFECRGVDSLTSYYNPELKRARVFDIHGSVGFELFEVDLRTADLEPLMRDVDIVIHLAAQPGVRASWSEFESYVQHNILVTHRLLEAAKGAVDRFVYASSSSVYGDSLRDRTTEEDLTVPRSPYGVTKLAGEHLCRIFAANYDLPTIMLRYFTVYGPGQRPDMAMHRLIEAANNGTTFPMYGSGEQIRDFTYVDDVVAANLAAATRPAEPGEVFNVAGGTQTSLLEVVATIEKLTGATIEIDRRPASPGDVHRTSGSTAKIQELLGWRPAYDLADGLAAQLAWHDRHRRLLVT